ncbi:MAG: helix-turn-helix domain-containing protein [Treponema sp.]|nr:helix-turn-helix domain-containing protein [Treponema sp.]
MESLGQKLKSVRESKDINFDQASRDTKISLRYLQALENEDFSGFPGETYITGFLRNYGAYLEIDVEELFSLYRALKIQEQPIPVEQLLKQPSQLPKIIIGLLIGVLVTALIGGIIFFFINRPLTTEVFPPAPRTPVVYTMSGDTFEQHLFRGDSILVSLGDEQQVKLELEDLGDSVTIGTPNGPVIVGLSQDANVEIDNGGTAIRITAIDYDRTRAVMGVRLRLEFNIPSGWETALTDTVNIPSQAITTVVFTSPNPHPFTLQSVFQGNCMFRWEILMERDRRERGQQYFQRFQEFNIQAQNGIRVWISNAQAARFSVIGAGRVVPFEIGNPGEVVVADIRWVRDDDNRFRLIVARLET